MKPDKFQNIIFKVNMRLLLPDFFLIFYSLFTIEIWGWIKDSNSSSKLAQLSENC